MQLRATLRDRVCASPLMDGPKFAAGVEKVYRGDLVELVHGIGKAIPLTRIIHHAVARISRIFNADTAHIKVNDLSVLSVKS